MKKYVEFSSLFDIQKSFPTEQVCIDYLTELRWSGNIVSPFAELSKVYNCKGNKYKCSKTGKYFTVRTDSIFEGSHIELRKWIMAIYIFTSHKKGISSCQLAKDIDVTQKSAWFMLHRLRFAMSQRGFWDFPLKGTVEIDETYLGGKEKNRHHYGNETDSVGHWLHKKAVVMGAVERKGHVVMKYLQDSKTDKMQKFVFDNVRRGSNLMSDEHRAYSPLRTDFNHQTVKHMVKEYVRGEVHTDTVENLWSTLKRGITGTYHFTSDKHLQAYLEEFQFRFNRRKETEPNGVKQFLTYSFMDSINYKTLIGKNAKH